MARQLSYTETKTLDPAQLTAVFHLWNEEYPATLEHQNIAAMTDYLAALSDIRHLLLHDEMAAICGWAYAFTRNGERWFAIIVSSSVQGMGYGAKLMAYLQATEPVLHGWVIDHDQARKRNGLPYVSPLAFYLTCGFHLLPDQRFETESLSAIKIRFIAGGNSD